MAYVSTEFSKKIRNQLKNEFPDIKFSVTKRHHTELVVVIKESSTYDFNQEGSKNGVQHYGQIDKSYKNPNMDILNRIKAICLADHWDQSDAMTDYFNTAYYFTLDIGTWEKPFIFTGAPTTPSADPIAPVELPETLNDKEVVSYIYSEESVAESILEPAKASNDEEKDKVLKIESIKVEWSESRHFEEGKNYTLKEYNCLARLSSIGVTYGYDKTKLQIRIKGYDDVLVMRHDINEANPTLTRDIDSRGYRIIDLTEGEEEAPIQGLQEKDVKVYERLCDRYDVDVVNTLMRRCGVDDVDCILRSRSYAVGDSFESLARDCVDGSVDELPDWAFDSINWGDAVKRLQQQAYQFLMINSDQCMMLYP